MYTFCGAVICLLAGYFFYGKFIERVFGPKEKRPTPCFTHKDGVDYVPMPTWKVFLIQFLNIAGTGPIFGAILGILYGPAAYLWIVLGCIFIGAVHDYLSAMYSLRRDGISLPEMVGAELGTAIRFVMRIFSAFLMILVCAVFVRTPAGLLSEMTTSWGVWGSMIVWMGIILVYYFFTTILPISSIIGRLYPLFGLALFIMAVGVGGNILGRGGWMPELTDAPFTSHHPMNLPIFPMLCITVACGAISGFHATQSPMMVRCIQNERLGRRVFYGSMIVEGLVALIWAGAAIKFAGSYEGLHALGDPAKVVKLVCDTWMGKVGAVLAMLGVVAAPITTGDTAMRSARLIVADFLHFKQDRIWKRLAIAVPLFGATLGLMMLDFSVLWRYFSWFNQTLAVFTLWGLTVWLTRTGRCYWVTLLPSLFMTMVSASYILIAPEGFGLSQSLGLLLGAILTTVLLCLYILWRQHSAALAPATEKQKIINGPIKRNENECIKD